MSIQPIPTPSCELCYCELFRGCLEEILRTGRARQPAFVTAFSFFKKLHDYHVTCQAMKSESAASLLAAGCELYHDLTSLLSSQHKCTFVSQAQDAVDRLAKMLDASGRSWVQQLLKDQGTEAGATAQQTIAKPTPFLQDCFSTIALCKDAEVARVVKSNVAEDASSFASLSQLMPVYARISSVQTEFLTEEQCVAFKNFKDEVEASMCALVENLEQTLQQFKTLAEKYRWGAGSSSLVPSAVVVAHTAVVVVVEVKVKVKRKIIVEVELATFGFWCSVIVVGWCVMILRLAGISSRNVHSPVNPFSFPIVDTGLG